MTSAALERKARAGHVTGGACFGYRNVEVVGTDGRRSHVVQEVDQAGATIVRQVFELSASGLDDGGEGPLVQLAKEITRVEGERSRLANAIATGGDLDGLLVAMKEREARLGQLGQHRQAVEARVARSGVGDLDRIRRELLALSADWRSLLTQQPVHARTILAKLVVGRVTFTPGTKAKQWELRGRGTIAGLFQAVFPLGMASQSVPSWNRLHGWLQEMDLLRQAA